MQHKQTPLKMSLTGRKPARHFRTWVMPTAMALCVGIGKHAGAQMNDAPGKVPITASHQADIIDSLSRTLNEYYVFPDVAEKMGKLAKSNFKKGEYKSITTLGEFTDRLTEDFRSVSHDLHLGVSAGEPRSSEIPDSLEDKRREHEEKVGMQKHNFGFAKIEILPGNIGYLDLRGFVPAEYAGATAVAAMNFMAHVDGLIFDLRSNGGGSPSMIQLICSYLFDEPTHLNSFYIRRSDSIQQFWTVAFVEGPRLSDVPVYVLTSRNTFSAAEEFTYNLKNLKRATIVGDTTGGGAHPVDGHWFRIDDQVFVEARIPDGRAINPITGTNWEGTGVFPDIVVASDRALDEAQLDFFEKQVKSNPDEKAAFGSRWAYQTIKTRLEPVSLAAESVDPYLGDFGPRHVLLENGTLYYQRENRPKFRMIPMGDDLFGLDNMDTFRIQFVRDSSGRVTELVGQYDNGMTDGNERTGNP